MIRFFRQLKDRLDQAEKFEDDRFAFYEERLSHLADRVKELDDLHQRERSALLERLEAHGHRIDHLDYWFRDVGRLVGAGGPSTDLETEIVSDSDPTDVESWDDEMNIMGMAMYPAPLGDEHGSES